MNGKVLTFYLGGSLYGIDIKLVKEINRNVDFTPVPGSDASILGLFNMRGQIVTIFNLAHIIGSDENVSLDLCPCIILKPTDENQHFIGFMIDKTGDVVDIEDSVCELPPANVSSIESDYIKSVVKLENDLLLVIEPGKIFTAEELSFQ